MVVRLIREPKQNGVKQMYPSIRHNGYSSSYTVLVSKDCSIKCHNLGTARYYYNKAKQGHDLSRECEPARPKA